MSLNQRDRGPLVSGRSRFWWRLKFAAPRYVPFSCRPHRRPLLARLSTLGLALSTLAHIPARALTVLGISHTLNQPPRFRIHGPRMAFTHCGLGMGLTRAGGRSSILNPSLSILPGVQLCKTSRLITSQSLWHFPSGRRDDLVIHPPFWPPGPPPLHCALHCPPT